MNEFLQIEILEKYVSNHEIAIRKIDSIQDDIIEIELLIDSKCWRIIIEDEYADFNVKNKKICLFLICYAFETYETSTDYLDWCNEYNISASNLKWINYYQSLPKIISEIEKELSSEYPKFSSFNYHLRKGVINKLLKN